MPEKQRSMRLLMIALLEMVAVLGTSGAQSTPDTQLRYKVDYQCNGERVQVGYCRKDDDGLGYGPPTKPQENYCMVYYPDRPKRGGFIVQSAELYDVVVKKLQACGALAGSAVAKSQSSNRTARDYRGEGEKYVDAKDYAHAVPLLQEAVRLNPNDALGQFLLGETYVYMGNKAGAAQIQKTLLTLDKEKADELQQMMGRSAAATKTAAPTTPLRRSDDDIEAQKLLLKGTAAEDEGNPRQALEDYQRALALHAGNDTRALIFAYQGSAYDNLKQYDKAVSSFRQSLQLVPEDTHTSYLLGLVYAKMGKKTEAMQIYQALLPTDKAEADHLYLKIQNAN